MRAAPLGQLPTPQPQCLNGIPPYLDLFCGSKLFDKVFASSSSSPGQKPGPQPESDHVFQFLISVPFHSQKSTCLGKKLGAYPDYFCLFPFTFNLDPGKHHVFLCCLLNVSQFCPYLFSASSFSLGCVPATYIYLFEELSKIMYISLIVWDLVLSRHSARVSNDVVTLLLKTLLFPIARKKNSSL